LLARDVVIPLDVKGARRSALRVVLGQVVLASLVSSALLLWVDARTGMSALLGGAIGAVASLGMITAMFAGSSALDARGALGRAFRGEAIKLALTVVLFVVVLKNFDVVAIALLAGYFATLFAHWFALLK
jgi:ATP synthase protein I